MADSAYLILTSNSKDSKNSGNFYIVPILLVRMKRS